MNDSIPLSKAWSYLGGDILSNNFSYIKQQYIFFLNFQTDKYHAATFLLCVQYLEMNED